MKEITANMIKELRERTGVGMGKCKEALVSAEGDVEKAIDLLRKAGMAAAGKKEGRETKEGLILAEEDKDHILLIEANAETDFVVQNERFVNFVQDCAHQALQTKATSLEQLLEQPYQKDKTISIDNYRNLVVQALGENILVRRIELIKKDPNSSYGIYSHMGGKLVVLVELNGAVGEESVAKEIGMHIAAENPDFISSTEIPADVISREEDIARSQVQGKPENMIDKIVSGKLKAFYDQVCLLNQKYVKDSTLTVEQFVDSISKKLGKPLSVKCFWRWKVGQ